MLLLIVLRLTHVLFGIFWVGAVVFIALYLIPSVRDAGPDGAKVMQALQRRHLLDVVPAAAVLTILSGLWLFWHDSAGRAGWGRTPMGMCLSLGALCAIVGFIIGVLVMRAATVQAGQLAASLPDLPQGPEKDARSARVQRLRLRAAVSARWVAALLTLAAAFMAVARYA
jgi:uncharacterized membrane protein